MEGHDAAAGTTWLRWGDRVLEAACAPTFAPGEAVDWLMPASAVVLHRRLRPSAGERENPVAGRIAEMLALGTDAHVTLDVGDPQGHPLGFVLPLHAAWRNGLAPRDACGISLLRGAIHVMPRAALP